MCVYVCISMYVCLCIYVSLYVFVCVCIYVSVYMCVCLCVYKSVFVYISLCVYLCVCVCVSLISLRRQCCSVGISEAPGSCGCFSSSFPACCWSCGQAVHLGSLCSVFIFAAQAGSIRHRKSRSVRFQGPDLPIALRQKGQG